MTSVPMVDWWATVTDDSLLRQISGLVQQGGLVPDDLIFEVRAHSLFQTGTHASYAVSLTLGHQATNSLGATPFPAPADSP